MEDTLIVIHVDTNKKYSKIVSGIRNSAKEYLRAKRPVYELLMPDRSGYIGLDGVILIPHGPGIAPGIDQILDIKLKLMKKGITQAEACGMDRHNCVAKIVEQLERDEIKYEHGPEHKTKIKDLSGYRVNIAIIEHLCNH